MEEQQDDKVRRMTSTEKRSFDGITIDLNDSSNVLKNQFHSSIKKQIIRVTIGIILGTLLLLAFLIAIPVIIALVIIALILFKRFKIYANKKIFYK